MAYPQRYATFFLSAAVPQTTVTTTQKVGAKIHAQKVGVFGEKTVTLHFGSVAASGSIGIGI